MSATRNPFLSLLKATAMSLMAAAMAFFIGDVVGILSLAIYQAFTDKKADFSLAYRAFGMPLGFLALGATFITVMVMEFRSPAKAV